MIVQTNTQKPSRRGNKHPKAFNRVFRAFTVTYGLPVRQIADDLSDYLKAHPHAMPSGVDYYGWSTIQSYRTATMPDDPCGFVDLCRAAIHPPRNATEEIPDSAWDVLKKAVYIADVFAAGQRFLAYCDEVNSGIRKVLDDDLRQRLAGWLTEVGVDDAEVEKIICELAQHER